MAFAAMTIVPVLLGQMLLRPRRHAAPAAATEGPLAAGDRASHPSNSSSWRAGILLSLCGAVAGPFLGVWLSLIACDRAPLGVAQTLLSLSPVFILPATAIIHGERISLRAAIGALLAVGGAAVLFGVTSPTE
jgi:drug/metabolite transporter (DMT)-like permease